MESEGAGPVREHQAGGPGGAAPGATQEKSALVNTNYIAKPFVELYMHVL